MQSDEQAIRDVIARWMQASKAGDTATVLSLMDEEVVFLLPGRPPMRGRDDFAEASKGMAGKFEMEGVSPADATEAMRLASHKLPLRTRFVKREGVH